MNLSAIQHVAFDNYCYHLNDDELEISILTGKDVERVFIVYGDPFSGGIMGGDWKWNGTEKEVTSKKELQTHFRWTTTVRPEFKRLSYYYKLVSGQEEYYYTYNGFFTKEEFENGGNRHGRFIFPWMNPCDTNKVPRWVEKTVWYQIFPARFCRGESNVKPEGMIPWGKLGKEIPRKMKEPVYGGNIQGMIDKLDYLQDLGITGIYTTPLNLSSSQHKYNTDDYEQIDPTFGDAAKMKEFVQKAHEHGIKIMLDGVFNHSGWMWDKWQDVWKKREKSAYKDWFMINDFNFVEPAYGYGKGNAGTGKIYSFAFVDWMPKLNTNNPELRSYIISVCEKWVKEYDIDGLRLDVANEISHVFCKELNKAMKALKPDFYIMGEIWHNSLPWLRGDEYDSVMNYPLQNSIADFVCSKDWNVKRFEYALNRCYSMYYRQTNRVLFNQMDSHDTIRILNRCDGNKNRAWQTLALTFAMTGSVCIYYGTEIMLAGGHDPDNRRCMPWSELEKGMFDTELAFTKKMIQVRKENEALCSPDYDFVYSSDDMEGKNRVIQLIKIAEKTGEKVCVIINAGEKDFELSSKISEEKILLANLCDGQTVKADGLLIYKLQA